MLKTQSNDRKRFFRFAVVGVSGTLVDISIFYFLNNVVGLPDNPSITISFMVAVVNNFVWNRNWTYPESKEKRLSEQLFKFSIVSVLGLLIRILLFAPIKKPLINIATYLFCQKFFIKPEIIGELFALATIIMIVLLWNYFINRVWTYKDIK